MTYSYLFISTALYAASVLFSWYQPAPSSSVQQTEPDLQESIKLGQEIYQGYCLACHMATGEGIPGAFPPLAKSDYLMADKERSIKQVLQGSQGEMVVNGQTYNGVMPPQPLSDEEVAHVLNYVRNSWGNEGEVVTFAEVQAVRDDL
uniref:Cytochrome c n=1 Tax=Roseihalotalea indica TaxID=2867963 RepID=A0AA49PYR4_9BACT|nr:cytochrome c [Tunicatimonas sp. TK19036]